SEGIRGRKSAEIMSQSSFAHQSGDSAEDNPSPNQKSEAPGGLFSSWLGGFGWHLFAPGRAAPLCGPCPPARKCGTLVPSTLSVTGKIQSARLESLNKQNPSQMSQVFSVSGFCFSRILTTTPLSET